MLLLHMYFIVPIAKREAECCPEIKVRSCNPTISLGPLPLMARPLRIEVPGAVYRVTSRGNARQGIVLDDRDRLHWLALLAHVIAQYG